MSSLSQALGGVGLLGAVAGRVVGGAGVPAGPDDAEPGAHEDADGVRVALAAGAGVAVEPGGPGGGVAGIVGPGAERLAGAGVGGPAEAHGPALAGGLGDRHGADLGRGLVGGGGAGEDRAGLGQDLGEVD